jgi:hypothetical protein
LADDFLQAEDNIFFAGEGGFILTCALAAARCGDVGAAAKCGLAEFRLGPANRL